MMKKILLIFLIGMFLISLTSAFLGTYEQGATVSVRGNLNASSVNVTIYFPNSSIAVDNQPMTQLKGEIWNYSFSSTDTLGEYIYDYCDQDGRNCRENNFEITPTGLTANLGFYILILIFSFGVIIFGVTRNDPTITLLGSFGLYFLGLYILFNGIVGVKDLVTTWAIGIIMLGLAMYVSLRSAYSLITEAE